MPAVLLAGPVIVAFAKPSVDERYAYYDVEGDTAQDLLHLIEAERGVDGFHAQTDWAVEWRYDWEETAEDCRIVGSRTVVDIEYLLPRWLGLDESDDQHLIETWVDYERALVQHEQGHGDIAIEAGAEVEAALLSMQPSEDCERLSRDADALAMEIIDDYRERNDAYDSDTDHGVTQGASFP